MVLLVVGILILAEKNTLFRIGFKNPDKQKQVKNVFVQFEASGIYSLGFYGLLEYVKMELSTLLGYEVTNDNLFPLGLI